MQIVDLSSNLRMSSLMVLLSSLCEVDGEPTIDGWDSEKDLKGMVWCYCHNCCHRSFCYHYSCNTVTCKVGMNEIWKRLRWMRFEIMTKETFERKLLIIFSYIFSCLIIINEITNWLKKETCSVIHKHT